MRAECDRHPRLGLFSLVFCGAYGYVFYLLYSRMLQVNQDYSDCGGHAETRAQGLCVNERLCYEECEEAIAADDALLTCFYFGLVSMAVMVTAWSRKSTAPTETEMTLIDTSASDAADYNSIPLSAT